MFLSEEVHITSLEQFFAQRVLKENYSEKRAEFLIQVMQAAREGHLCLKLSEKIDLPSFIVQDEGLEAPIIRQGDRYYLQRNWVYETSILQHVARLRSITPALEEPLDSSASLLESQKRAITEALRSHFSIICGGPGTGKTYTASHLVRWLVAHSNKGRYKVALTAPTGKAVSHLQAVLGSIDAEVEASTLHRLLRISPGKARTLKRKIDADLVIVDEASMLDVPLLLHLLESIGGQTRLILMGDPNQLPPVEAGSLFAEMANLFGSQLERSMRTDNAHLLSLAEAINRGEWADREVQLPWKFDSQLGPKLYEKANPLISSERPDPLMCLERLGEFRILGALRQGPFGIDALNRQIVQEMGVRIRPGQWWAVPIMITANEPRSELYNGTCGILIGKSLGGIHLSSGTAYFPEMVEFRNLPPFEIAFCLSIHKSQGSEFKRVLAIFPQGSENFGREAIYTAVTRAKECVEIVAEETVVRAMLVQRVRKLSGFTARMRNF